MGLLLRSGCGNGPAIQMTNNGQTTRPTMAKHWQKDSREWVACRVCPPGIPTISRPFPTPWPAPPLAVRLAAHPPPAGPDGRRLSSGSWAAAAARRGRWAPVSRPWGVGWGSRLCGGEHASRVGGKQLLPPDANDPNGKKTGDTKEMCVEIMSSHGHDSLALLQQCAVPGALFQWLKASLAEFLQRKRLGAVETFCVG